MEQVVGVGGIAPGDHVVLTAPRDLEAGLIAMPLFPDVAGKLPLRVCNLSGADVNAELRGHHARPAQRQCSSTRAATSATAKAFTLVKRDGKEFYIYGTGKDRLVACLKRKDPADDTASARAKTETTAPATDTTPSGTTGTA